MKIVVRAMGGFLVAAVAVILVISAIAYSLVPNLSQYIRDFFPSEKNLELVSVIAADPDSAHAEPVNEEIYETAHYIYTYDEAADGWQVSVKDNTAGKYSPLYEAIYGKPVVSLKETFKDCAVLTQAPAIPSGVKDLSSAFSGCVLLNGSIVVHADPERYEDCFAGTKEDIVLVGSSSVLEELSDTAGDGNVSVK